MVAYVDHTAALSPGTGGVSSGSTATSLPTHAAGDLMLMGVTGKPPTAGIPTINQGWTLLASGTGGTGTTGVDAGPLYWAVFGKYATSGSETAPNLTVGSPASNVQVWEAIVYRLGAGASWLDSLATIGTLIQTAHDTTTAASPLTGTASAFASQPTTGDAIVAFGATPTDSTTFSSATLTATGLSGGTVTGAGGSTGTGNDMTAVWSDWVNFSGTASSGVTATFNFSAGSNTSGPIVLIPLRQVMPTTVSGGTATTTATAQAGSVSTVIAGGVAAVTATALAGVVLAGALVSGGQAATASTALAGSVLTGTGVAGGQASTTSSALAGTVTGGALVVGGQASTTSAAAAGTIAQSITGGQVTTTSTALAGNVVTTIHGGQATTTSTALAGSTGGDLILGGTAITTASALAGTISLGYYVTDTSNADDGIRLTGTAQVVWEPDVEPVPVILAAALGERRTVAHVITRAPGDSTAFLPATKLEESIPGLRERVLLNDQDITFFRDAVTQVGNLRLIDPLLYGSGEITLPQINPQFEQLGIGALAAFKRFARVVVQLVDADDVVIVPAYYKGFVSKINTDGHQLVLELGGQASGRLSAMYVPPAVYRKKQDAEFIILDTLRDARIQAHQHDGDSGVSLIRRGGSDGLSILNETLAVWAGVKGTALTVTPNADGVYRKIVKDVDTIHATAHIDSDLITQSLSQDFMEQFTRVYANGRTANGELVSFIRSPGLTQTNPPTGELAVGDTDAATEGMVSVAQRQLTICNYLDYADVDPGIYDEEMAEAVRELQADAGLITAAVAGGFDGDLNDATWDALFNLSITGYSLDDARQYPAWQDPRVSEWNRSGNGSKISENEDYDPHLIPVDTVIDVGGPFGQRQIKRFAKSKGDTADGAVWTGTLTFKSGLIVGDHTVGDPFNDSMVMDRRELLPNMNIKLPYFMGGVVVTISGLDHGPEETQALVSTLPQTTMETWDAIERARESRSNPGRTWSGHIRSSQVRNDTVPEWDTSSGYVASVSLLFAGAWTEVRVPAGQTGIVQCIKLELRNAAEFAVILSQKSLEFSNDADSPLNIVPLTEPESGQRPWWEREAIAEWFEERGVLEAWGTWKQPCGYDPSIKTDEDGPTAQAMTGKFYEQAGFNYETDVEPILYLYVWTAEENILEPGRYLRNQRTSGY